jgi:hypothetical protein
MRMENTRTTRKITEWTPYKTRPAGEIQIKVDGRGIRRPKEYENYWLEDEGRRQTGME